MIQAPFRCGDRHAKLAGIVTLALIALVGLGVSAQTPKAARETSLTDILGRAGKYVHQFEQDFGVVICDEEYRQQDYPPPDRGVSVPGDRNGQGGMFFAGSASQPFIREIGSEMLFVRGEQEVTWLAVRNVLTVKDNGFTVPEAVVGSKDRIDRALKDTSSGQFARLRTLAHEGARFNLGRIYRNFNTPTLALQFLAPEFQPRFTFRIAGREKVAGQQAVKLEYTERGSPTVIALNDKSQLPASGVLWVGEADGAVLRTHLTVKALQTDDGPGLDATIRVDYGLSQKLEMWVPSYMYEKYVEHGQPVERVECRARYSNFRRFETSARIVSPK
jgi:hypothetical protein